jgi:hypothetical protein
MLLIEGFCAFPDTIEAHALQVLPAIRAVPPTERRPDHIASTFSVPFAVAAKAIAYVNQEPSPQVRQNQWYASVCCSVGLFCLSAWFLCERTRAVKTQRHMERVVDYLERSRTTPTPISSILARLGLSGQTSGRRIVNRLQQMPQFDVIGDSVRIVRPM